MFVKRFRFSFLIFILVVFPIFLDRQGGNSFFVTNTKSSLSSNDGRICQELANTVVSKDVIAPIENPKYLSPDEFENSFSQDYLDNIKVIGVIINGEAKAYPIDILIQHEIVNDNIGGEPVSITYCPLTGSSIIYLTSSIGGSTLGTTGKLLWNNLVFYDRETDTYWSQMYNLAWCGARSGSLDMAPVIETTWNAWKALYPDTEILSRDTGFIRNYDFNPYGDYATNDRIVFPAPWIPNIAPYNIYHKKAFSLVLSLDYSTDLETFIFPYEELEKYPLISFNQGNRSVVIFYDKNNDLAVPYLSQLSNGTTLNFSETIANESANLDNLGLTTFKDSTDTIWNIRGEAIEGPMKGEKLTQINSYSAYWFAATSFFINARFFISNEYYTNIFVNGTYIFSDYNPSSPDDTSTRPPIAFNNTSTAVNNETIPGFSIITSLMTLGLIALTVLSFKRR